MPYVRCPSCEQVGHVPAQRRGLDLCPHCGDALGRRRTVVSLSRHPGLNLDPPARLDQRAAPDVTPLAA
jgi:hypothetical protein